MTEQVQAQTESASPAASFEPSVAAAPESPSQPTEQADAKQVERTPDGKFVKRGLPEAWKSKPDQFAAERQAVAKNAPPVPSEQASAVPVAQPSKKEANFVPQPRFDQVIAERARAQQELQAARRELEEHRAEIQRLRSYQPPQQAQEQLPPELAEYFGVPASEKPPAAVAQLLQQVQQQQ